MTDRGHRKGAILIFLALMGGLQAFASERLVIPFEMNEQDHMVIHMEVNGDDRAIAMIDTAATFPMIDRRTARLAGVLDPGEDPVMVNVLGLTGEDIFPVVELDRLMVGNVVKTDIPVALNLDLDVLGAASVLPASAFEGDVIDFDFSNGRVMIYNGRPDRKPGQSPSSLRYEETGGLMFVEVRINGRKGRALIDTGSSITYVNSRFAENARMTANVEKTQILQGATGGDQSLRVSSARLFAIGDYRVARVDVLVSDPPLFEYLGMHEEPAMVLGLDLLSAFRMQIDRRRHRIILSLPDDGRNTKTLNLNARDTRIPAY
jgi:predicted aspartyl protease